MEKIIHSPLKIRAVIIGMARIKKCFINFDIFEKTNFEIVFVGLP